MNSLVLLHLSLIDGVGPGVIKAIQTIHGSRSLELLYDVSAAQLAYEYGLSPAMAQKIVTGLSDTDLVNQEVTLIQKHRINWMSWDNPAYPALLKQIHLPPVIIYWRGTLPTTTSAVAFVGSREANRYGQKVISSLVPELVQKGWAIISGGALGADTMAHQTALDNKGVTVAVLGSGLLKPYPASNSRLFDAIVAGGGAIVSSFSLETSAHPGHFPARNRIISGLSRGCVVVQAAAKSGALITAQFAVEQGRDVFAVPGAIDDPLSAGCHGLLTQGAKLITCADDILTEYGQTVPQTKVKKDNSTVDDQQVEVVQAPITPGTMADTIVAACKFPCSTDDLLTQTGLSIQELMALLFDLQLSGYLVQNFAGLWEAC